MSDKNPKVTKIELLRKIHQQRLDLGAEKRAWYYATARYDRGWNTLLGLRKYLIAGSSLLALYNIRHPSRLILWTKRALGIIGTIRLIRSTLQSR
ncbi:YqjK-like family protein [Acerihabitans arboris]|uniref:Cell division protein FtsH n=1 Tax=Acerihabitans arboris TaxID=2691583 RepID=A0A845SJL8_9GAMM|nr:YqjK-like family protein [Acerihabitans arboris]NDL63572.1 cell division protein FtsH [Acerihabitans arboris]